MKKILLFIACFSTSAMAENIIKYDWLTMGKKSGEQTVNYVSKDQIEIDFQFSDRGRGPKVKEMVWLNEQGLITKQQLTGNSYMGAKIDEQFLYSNGSASWKNTQENEKVKLDKLSLYIAADSTPYSLDILVKAIAKAENQTLQLLPSGTATFKKIASAQVNKGNLSKTVNLIAISGLGLGPTYTWFDQELNLFALAYGWMGMAPEGWGDNLEKLQKIQDDANIEYYKSLAKQHILELTDVTIIDNINLFTATDNKLIKDTKVAIKNGKVLAIGKQVNQFKANKIFDGKGRTLMPGLWDMHAHISLDDGLLNIANGVTSVRDLANKHEQVMQATEMFTSGAAIGPSIYRAGFIDKKSPYSAPTGKLAETLEQALEYVDWYADHGYQQIKIYSSVTPAWVKPIAERVHQRGMKLSGHIPSFMTTEQAVKDGFDEIQHINMVFLNFLAGPEDDTRTPVRFTLVGEEAGKLELNSKAVNEFIQLLKANNTIVDPTVTIFHSMFVNKAGEIDPGYRAIAAHLPANVTRGFLGASLEITEANEKQYAASAEALLKMIYKLYQNGVRLVAGTDAIVGFTLHRELELYAKAGIPNYDVLKIATVNSARIAGRNDVGTIEEGMQADLILIDGNPLEDISNIRKVALVIKGGQAFEPEKIFNSIGIKPFTSL